MQRLFEGGYYSKYYRNAATIRGRLLFEVHIYIAATIYFSTTAMRRLFEAGYYIFEVHIYIAATIYFITTAMRRLFEAGYYSKYMQTSRLLFISALPQCGDYSKPATIRSTCRRRGYYLFQRYRNAATIRSRLLFEVHADVAATIYFSATAMWRLFEGGYYSRCGVYSRKYGNYINLYVLYMHRLLRPQLVRFICSGNTVSIRALKISVKDPYLKWESISPYTHDGHELHHLGGGWSLQKLHRCSSFCIGFNEVR